MDNSGRVHGIYGISDLSNDVADLFRWKGDMLLRIFFEELAERPFDGEKVNAGSGFTNFDRSHDVGMGNARAIRRFAKKSRNCGLIRSQLFL